MARLIGDLPNQVPLNGMLGTMAYQDSNYISVVDARVSRNLVLNNATVNGLTVSGTTTLSGGLANGVVYLDGSKVATAGSALTFNGVTLGVTNSTLDMSSGYPIRWGGAASSIYGSSGTSDMVFTVGSTERMRINGSSGNVGIGILSPFTRFDSASARTTALNSIGSFNTMPASVTDTTAYAAGVGGGINFRAQLGSSTYATYAAIWSSREVGTVNDYRGSLVFGTSDNADGYPEERMRLDSSGDLGIGTNNPANRLVVSNAGAQGFEFDPLTGVFQVYNRATSAYGELLTYASQLLFFTGASPTERMRLDTSGNLGIGTSSPGSLLHLNAAGGGDVPRIRFTNGSTGTGATDGSFVGISNSTQIDIWNFESSDIRFGTSNAERMRLDNAGNLGLGVTPSAWGSGSRALQLPNNGSLANDGSLTTLIGQNWFRSATGNTYITTGAAALFSVGAGNFIWYNAPSGTAGNAISFTQAMTLAASGNLGIGTTSPGAKLESSVTSAGATSEVLRLSNPGAGANTQAQINFYTTSTSYATITGGYSAFAPQMTFNLPSSTAGNYVWQITGTERMRLDTSGNLGIGTISPSTRLTVFGGSKIGTGVATNNATLMVNQPNGSAAGIQLFQDGQESWIMEVPASSPALRWTASGAEQMRLNSVGLGIGGIPSSARLTVIGTTTGSPQVGAIFSNEGLTAGSTLRLNFLTGEDGTVGRTRAIIETLAPAANDGALGFQTRLAGNVSEKMRLDAAGNLGIGTTVPASKLHVQDVVAAGRVNITLSNNATGNLANRARLRMAASSGFFGTDLHPYIEAYEENVSNAAEGLAFGTYSGSVLVERMRIDAAGNLGLGVTPSAWESEWKSFDIGLAGSVTYGLTEINVGNNFYRLNTGAYRYKSTAVATNYIQVGGQHRWFNAPSGTAGNAISFTQAMTLAATGDLGVGLTNPSARLHTSTTDAAYALGISGTTRGVRVETNATETRFVGVDQTLIASFQPISIGGSQVVIRANGTTEVARFNTSGNLALGNITSSAWYTNPFIDIGLYGAIGNNSGGGGGFALYANAYEDTSGTFKYKNTYSAALYRTFNAQHQWFNAPSGTAGNTISFTQAMTLDADGDLGIGTTSPGVKLDVVGVARASSRVVSPAFYGSSTGVTEYMDSLGTTGMFVTGAGASPSNSIRFYSVGSTIATLDSSGNLGLGVTPATWFSGYKAIQVNTFGGLYSFSTNSGLATNAYDDGVWKFSGTGFANRYLHLTGSGNHQWLTSTASGSAGGAITWSTPMTLDSSGNLGLGVTPSAQGVYRTMQFGNYTTIGQQTSGTSQSFFGWNVRGSSTVNQYLYNATGDKAALYEINSDASHRWYVTNTSGTAGNAITFTQAMTLDASGNLGLGVTPSGNYTLQGAANFAQGFKGALLGTVTIGASGSEYGSVGYNVRYTASSGSYLYNVGDTANMIRFSAGAFQFLQAASGTGGGAISFTQAMTLDASGNLGLGVTPSAWNAGKKVIQFASGSLIATPNTAIELGQNFFITSGGTSNYINNGFATDYAQTNGQHLWYNAPSGTAGNAISFTQAMTLDTSSRLTVGTTTNTNSSTVVSGGTISETVSSVQYLVASQFDVGTAPNKIPLNQYLGKLAYQDIPVSSSNVAGMGYVVGAGGAVTQGTSRTTGVTLNTPTGAITLFSAAGTTAWQSFTVTNSTVAVTDTIKVVQRSGTDLYQIFVTNVAAGSFRITFATTAGTTTEQPVFNFAVIKAVAS